jgi:membrane protein implicated in regulation of membrane protease activity
MRFQVPQFIETEAKLIGPLTLRQFLWVAGGVSMLVLEVMLLSGIFLLAAAILTLVFFGALAFLKVEGMPFVNFLAYALSYALGAKEYLFRQSKSSDEVDLPDVPNTQ